MSALVSLWAFAGVLGASLILQGVAMRIVHRRKAARQHAKHLQFQQTMNRQFEQTKRQIGQLQNDLAAARLQLRQRGRRDVASTQSRSLARQAIDRELDNASASRYSRPIDGFADTQPAPAVTQNGSLLLQ